MACGESCINCRYGEFSPKDDEHIGKNDDRDVWCDYYGRWVGCSGSCSNYEEE